MPINISHRKDGLYYYSVFHIGLNSRSTDGWKEKSPEVDALLTKKSHST